MPGELCRTAEIGGDRRRRGSVRPIADRRAGAALGDRRDQPALAVVAVDLAGAGHQVAGGDQLAGSVVGVADHRAIGRLGPGDLAGAVLQEQDAAAIRRGHAVAADHEVALRGLDFRHAQNRVDHIGGAIGPGQHIGRATGGIRVVGGTGDAVVIGGTRLDQRAVGVGRQCPAAGRIVGNPGRVIQRDGA